MQINIKLLLNRKNKPKSNGKSSEIPNLLNKEKIVVDDNLKLVEKNTTITISDSGDPSLRPSINNNNIILKISQPQQNENKYSKRKVINNWDKYEEKSQVDSHNNNQDNEQLVAADFQKLLDAPQSIGSHFYFNSEKQWIEEDTSISSAPLTTTTTTPTLASINNNKFNKIQNQSHQQSSQKYFNLNLSLLIEGITSIPFYERQNYPIDLFNNDEIEDMRRRSNEIKFSRKTDKNNIIKSVVIPTTTQSSNKLKTNVDDQKFDKDKVIPNEINKTSNDDVAHVKIVDDDDEEENELDKLFDSNLNTDKLPIALNKMNSVKIINKNINAEETRPSIVKKVIGNTKEDIQQWLDDILDD